MKQIDNLLAPDQGMMLTQAAEVGIESRIVTKCVCLAVNDSPDNWREITEEEADTISAEQAELFKRKEVQP